jgi:hypothetical protein
VKPADVGGRYNLGLALLQLGKQSEAVIQFQEALRIQSDYEPARQQLRRLNIPVEP